MQTLQLVELVFKKQFSALLWKFVSGDKEVFSVIEVELISLRREGVFVYRRQVNFHYVFRASSFANKIYFLIIIRILLGELV